MNGSGISGAYSGTRESVLSRREYGSQLLPSACRSAKSTRYSTQDRKFAKHLFSSFFGLAPLSMENIEATPRSGEKLRIAELVEDVREL